MSEQDATQFTQLHKLTQDLIEFFGELKKTGLNSGGLEPKQQMFDEGKANSILSALEQREPKKVKVGRPLSFRGVTTKAAHYKLPIDTILKIKQGKLLTDCSSEAEFINKAVLCFCAENGSIINNAQDQLDKCMSQVRSLSESQQLKIIDIVNALTVQAKTLH
ncbi:MAG: hypothetical protein HRT88_00115 [Lentisphaeraceae bacterium]|nr:hypothetical protein [Lentisphaeraceae bacterium]